MDILEWDGASSRVFWEQTVGVSLSLRRCVKNPIADLVITRRVPQTPQCTTSWGLRSDPTPGVGAP